MEGAGERESRNDQRDESLGPIAETPRASENRQTGDSSSGRECGTVRRGEPVERRAGAVLVVLIRLREILEHYHARALGCARERPLDIPRGPDASREAEKAIPGRRQKCEAEADEVQGPAADHDDDDARHDYEFPCSGHDTMRFKRCNPGALPAPRQFCTSLAKCHEQQRCRPQRRA